MRVERPASTNIQPNMADYKPFKDTKSDVERKSQFRFAKEKHPDRIPVIIEKSLNETVLGDFKKKKFVFPKDHKMSTVSEYVHQQLIKDSGSNENQTVFLFSGSELVSVNETISELYEKNKDEDGFLYLTYQSENTFGHC